MNYRTAIKLVARNINGGNPVEYVKAAIEARPECNRGTPAGEQLRAAKEVNLNRQSMDWHRQSVADCRAAGGITPALRQKYGIPYSTSIEEIEDYANGEGAAHLHAARFSLAVAVIRRRHKI